MSHPTIYKLCLPRTDVLEGRENPTRMLAAFRLLLSAR